MTKYRVRPFVWALLLFAPFAFASESGSEKEPWELAQETEVWEPVPPVVEAPPSAPPSDAKVLFDGKSLQHWQAAEGGPAPWTVKDGAFTVKPQTGDIKTRADFCDVQLHIEWRTPTKTTDEEGKPLEGQARGNSGVFFEERYEVQVLDSYQNKTYPNGQAASIYKQSIPAVNATRPPGEWQTYDIIFNAPRFNKNGSVKRPARITVLHNGVLVQNHVEVQGATAWIGEPEYEAHGCAPLRLQDHGDTVSFRNIWIREL
jgi:hypothetical protein